MKAIRRNLSAPERNIIESFQGKRAEDGDLEDEHLAGESGQEYRVDSASDTLLLSQRRKSSKSSNSTTLGEILAFPVVPSDDFVAFHQFLRKERSEENLELWLAIRNHTILFRRYKEIRRQYKDSPDLAIIEKHIDSEQKRMTHVVVDQVGTISNKSVCDVSSLFVDRKMLRRSAKDILITFLIPGSSKEVNVPDSIRRKVLESIKNEKRYDPVIFQEVRNCIFDLMATDSLPRFLRQDTNHNTPFI
ncbi:hypothetical protein MP638_004485 [Amoeboaphelidium occidentale]|nr:hypothetical protein MP638_004485 [Amoeboaphelidium occidentale]